MEIPELDLVAARRARSRTGPNAARAGEEEMVATVKMNEYQERAMETNHWPRVYTERQVIDIVTEWYARTQSVRVGDIVTMQTILEEVLDEKETPLNLIIYPMLGLAGEMGEVAEKLKKIIRDDDGVITEEHMDALELELGDVGWYQAAMSKGIGRTLSSVAKRNLDKLASRRARGVLRGSGDER